MSSCTLPETVNFNEVLLSLPSGNTSYVDYAVDYFAKKLDIETECNTNKVEDLLVYIRFYCEKNKIDFDQSVNNSKTTYSYVKGVGPFANT